jgi:hypothetical protein
MRSIKLAPAAAAVAALLVAVPGGTAAVGRRLHPGAGRHNAGGRPRVPGDCQVSIDVAPPLLTAGDPVVIFGQLTCGGGASAAGQAVALFQHLPSGRGYSQVQSVTTDANGFYEFPPIDGVDTESAWYVRSDGARSRAEQARVAAVVTLDGPAEGSQLLTGSANAVTFTGAVSQADAGYSVRLERQDSAAGGVWDPLGPAGQVGAEGGFTITHAFLHPGPATIRAVVTNRAAGNPHNSPSASNVLDYEISQAQGPSVTIQASADPIEAGQAVTISGTGPAHRRVTLRAATAHGRLATIATTTTDAGGKYAFPAQAPSASTFYRVRVGNTSSAELLVGVKDVLSANVSATTVQAGQPLTFSGTVTPEHSGHTIYLERENASGAGFHVVEVATVGSGSSYSIAHSVYDAGTSVYRVTIPGGPENEGASSAPFTIEVTPAPPAALIAEGLGNSSQPLGNHP